MGLAANDQLTLVAFAPRPAGEPVGDNPLGEFVELGLAVGVAMRRARLRFGRTSILVATVEAAIPVTVHVAIGTDCFQ